MALASGKLAPFVLSLLVWSGLLAFNSAQASDTSQAFWVEVSAPDRNTRYCANHAKRAWNVSLKSGSVQITHAKEESRPEGRDPLPFKVTVPPQTISSIGDRYVRRVVRVDNGYIVGFDEGEWGGSLWWFSTDGKDHKVLIGPYQTDESGRQVVGNVASLFDLSGGPVALIDSIGSCGVHCAEHTLGVYRVMRQPNGDWSDAHLLQLHGYLQVAALEGRSDALVLTSRDLWRISSADYALLSALDTNGLNPNSTMVDAQSDIYVGMRQYVLELSKTASGYASHWFAPADCVSYAGNGFLGSCTCQPQTGSSP